MLVSDWLLVRAICCFPQGREVEGKEACVGEGMWRGDTGCRQGPEGVHTWKSPNSSATPPTLRDLTTSLSSSLPLCNVRLGIKHQPGHWQPSHHIAQGSTKG